MQIRFDIRWLCGDDRTQEITVELFCVLRGIRENGSLRAAAAECGLSYRHAWGLLQKWEALAGHPLVALERGRGAKLTPFGEKLVQMHQRIQSAMESKFREMAAELNAELNTLFDGKQRDTLKIAASHGLAVAMLRDLASTRFQLDLELQFHGSLDSLQCLKAGNCELAGFHIPEGEAGARFLPRIRRYLNPASDAVIYAVRRRQGLITARDNPHAIRDLRDLVQKPVRFINRQKNSGTRTTFDFLLDDAGIDPKRIQGYRNEEFTHLAVAALVSSGAVDCAFGIEEAAKQFKLHFIPFNWEAYWFALARNRLATAGVTNFLRLLHSPEFHARATELSGYDSARAGSVVMLDSSLHALLS